MKLGDVQRRAVAQLVEHGITSAARDVRALIAHAIGISPDRVIFEQDRDLSSEQINDFNQIIKERCECKPVSRILGYREFWGRRFEISDDVLDPRGDTETLVHHALQHNFSTVLDLGTGSGAIVISLLAERPLSGGVATDISEQVLEVARRNALNLGVSARVTFSLSNWFEALDGKFDLIVSNPPYIDAAELNELARDVTDYDPHIALSPGEDGLAPYRIIAQEAGGFLSPQGGVIVEIGHTQGPQVRDMFKLAGFRDVNIIQDLDGKDRVVSAFGLETI
jgi:release factor glutamine methyltransferase